MKKIFNIFVIISFVLICFSASAQQNQLNESVEQSASAEKHQFMGLDLSPEQKVQFDEIKRNIVLNRSALKQNSGTDKDEALKMVEEYQQKIYAAFKEILTAEQLELFNKNIGALNNSKELNLDNKIPSNQK